MDPGPVPPELTVSVPNAYTIYLFRHLNVAIGFNIPHINEATTYSTHFPT